MVSKGSPYPLFVALVLLSGMAGLGRGQSSTNTSAGADPAIPAPQVMNGAADGSRCVFCHRSEVDGYQRSAMAHSLRRAGQEPEGTVEAHGAKITMSSSPSGYWQRLESGGEVTNYRIDYVIGSGNHASGYLLDLAGHLFQSPVAYYHESPCLRSWRPDTRDWRIRISLDPSLKDVFSATQDRTTHRRHLEPISLSPIFRGSDHV